MFALISEQVWTCLILLTGEKLTKEEAKGLMNELCDPEDAEGFTPFMRKFIKLNLNSHKMILV